MIACRDPCAECHAFRRAAPSSNERPSSRSSAECLRDVIAGRGRLALVSGEAGVGKTALARHFCDGRRDEARVLWGACDALHTPRPLGPLLDVARYDGWPAPGRRRSGDRTPRGVRGARGGARGEETDDRRPRGSPLGRRGDARCPESSRPPGRALTSAGRRDLPGRRARPWPSTPARARRVSAGQRGAAAPAARALGHGRGGARGATPCRCRGSASPYGGNPFFVTEVLAAGGRRSLRRSSMPSWPERGACRPRHTACSRRSAIVPPRMEMDLLRALAGRASRISTSASPRACSRWTATESRSGTSWPDWRSRARSARTNAPGCIATP